jgi:hypothetical protein
MKNVLIGGGEEVGRIGVARKLMESFEIESRESGVEECVYGQGRETANKFFRGPIGD